MGIPISISIKKGYLQENINISSKRDNPKIKTKTLEKNIKNKSYAI